MIILDRFHIRNRGDVLTMHLTGREPIPGDTIRKLGTSDAYRVLGVERNRRMGPLHEGEPLGLMVERGCPYGVGDDVEVIG
jgi:hypothetical protein